MGSSYVLIDFENVQPRNLEVLRGHAFRVYVFVGANQTKVSIDLAAAMQPLGESAHYVRISGNGKNALDFHIAYYIGELAAQKGNEDALFYIISRDTGFDPLIDHLKSKNIRVQRERDLAEIPALRISSGTSSDEKIAAIVKNLAGRGHSRPRKVKSLGNTINSLLAEDLDDQQLAELVKELEKRGHIEVNNGNVAYHLGQQG